MYDIESIGSRLITEVKQHREHLGRGRSATLCVTLDIFSVQRSRRINETSLYDRTFLMNEIKTLKLREQGTKMSGVLRTILLPVNTSPDNVHDDIGRVILLLNSLSAENGRCHRLSD